MCRVNLRCDIRLSWRIALPGEGCEELARPADCNPGVVGVPSCRGDAAAMVGEARFRACV